MTVANRTVIDHLIKLNIKTSATGAVAGSTPVSSTKKKISSMLSLINKDKILSSLKKTIGVVMADCKVG